MERRSFLGSVIGMFLATPLIARDAFKGKFYEPTLDTPYRLGFYELDHKIHLCGSPVKEVKYTDCGIIIVGEDILIKEAMILGGAILFNHKGEPLRKQRFSAPIYVCNGDTLKITSENTLSGINVKNLEKALLAGYLYNEKAF